MGAPSIPKPIKPPAPMDETKALINAINFESTNRKIRSSSGRKSTALAAAPAAPVGSTSRTPNTFTGQ